MKRNSVRLLLIAPMLALAATAAQAQSGAERGGYGGFSVGQALSAFSDDSLPVAGATASTLSNEDNASTGFKLYGGYRLLRWLAVEAGYASVGSLSATRNVTAPFAGSLRSDIKSKYLFFDAVGILPIVRDKFEFFGTLGFVIITTNADLSTTGGAVLTGNSHHVLRQSNAKIGLGAEFHFSPTLGLRFEAEDIPGVGDKQTIGKFDINMFSLGVTYRF